MVDSIALDIGIPISCGGDPGPVGSVPMLHCSLIEGMGDNLPCARVYARHQSAISMLLKCGTQKQKDAACLDSVAGMMTAFEVDGKLELNSDGMINGEIVVGGAGEKAITNLLVSVKNDDDEQLVLINKNKTGISIGESLDDFGKCIVSFENVELEDEMVVPAENDTDYMAQVQSLIDYYHLLISAAQLGMLKRSFAAQLEIQSIKTMGNQRMIKHDLVQSHMAKLQVPIYALESTIYGVAGKYSWSAESLSSECLVVRSLANESNSLLSKMSQFSGHLFLREPWTTRSSQLNVLSRECSTPTCHRLIGIRGFQVEGFILKFLSHSFIEPIFFYRKWVPKCSKINFEF